MKRTALLRHLRKHGCVLKREGRQHSLWLNPRNGQLRPYLGTSRSRTFLQERSAAVSLFRTWANPNKTGVCSLLPLLPSVQAPSLRFLHFLLFKSPPFPLFPHVQ